MRVSDLRGQKLLDDHFTIGHNSVTHLNIVRCWQLLVGNMNGCVSVTSWLLCMFDDIVCFVAGPLRPPICAGVWPIVGLRRTQQFVYNWPGAIASLFSFVVYSLAGHICKAIAVDPSEDFIFAAGQDRHIRAWSLQSGQAIQPPISCSPSTTNPFRMEFNRPVAAMQVVDRKEGMCLWAASDRELFKFHLGQLRNWFNVGKTRCGSEFQ